MLHCITHMLLESSSFLVVVSHTLSLTGTRSMVVLVCLKEFLVVVRKIELQTGIPFNAIELVMRV